MNNQNQKILIIGEVFVDTHLDITNNNSALIRLGGIFHSARALDSIGIKYALAYYAPNYLDDDINKWSFYLNAQGCYKLGNINRAPNVMLITESTEAGDQGYNNILKDQAEYAETGNICDIIDKIKPTDILIYPGRYGTSSLLKKLRNFSGKIHIDYHYDSQSLNIDNNQKIETVITSTSSDFYKKACNCSLDGIIKYFRNYNIRAFLIKENRGGAFCYNIKDKTMHESASYYVPTMHSVGVGDVFNAVFISQFFGNNISKRMKYASLCAAKYAETMDYEQYKKHVEIIYKNMDDIQHLTGIRLPWDTRNTFNIYLAAPDFPDIDTKLLDQLSNALSYHNFKPRLPIRENGLASKDINFNDEMHLYNDDIDLLNKCDLLIAVLLFNDPGTHVELGMFKQANKPVIIYDPFDICKNMFVKHTPDYICRTIAEVIEATYLCLGRSM